MLRLTLTDLLILGIPESLLVILSVCLFSQKRLTCKHYILSVILYSASGFIVRMLPISFGVHTIINIIVLILICLYMLKISVLKAISYTFITFILVSFCEAVYFTLMTKLLKFDIVLEASNNLMKDLYEFPSLILFAIVILMVARIYKKSKSVSKSITN